MSYIRRVLAERPISLWQPSGVTLADVSGNAVSLASSTGTAVAHAPLQPSSTNSLRVSGTASFTLPSGDLFFPGMEKRPFTLEAWIHPLQTSGTHPFLSHSTLNDGLAQVGGALQFAIPLTTGTVKASYTPQSLLQEWHMVGVFDGSKVYLYLDGDLKATYSLTAAEDAAQFASSITTKQFLVGTGNFVIDAIGIYASPLNSEQIQAHFLYGQRVRDYHDNINAFGGTPLDVNDSTANIIYEKNFLSRADWMEANYDGVNFNDFKIEPLVDESGTYVGGTWTFPIALNGLGLSTWQGGKIEWDGTGTFTVQTSKDEGANWTTETNYTSMAVLATGASLTGIDDLLVKITFTAGTNPTTTPTAVTALRIVIYRDQAHNILFGTKTLTRSGLVRPSTYVLQPNEMDQRANALFGTSGTLVLSADSDTPQVPVRTVDVWFSTNSLAASQTIFTGTGISLTLSTGGVLTATGAAAVYRNGALNSGFADALVANAWYHLVVVLSADYTGALTFGSGAFTLGTIAVYPTALSAGQVTSLYTTYISTITSSFVDPVVTTLTEQGFTTYAHSWSVTGAG